MSLILHMKIPGAIVAASDCRITGSEDLYVPVRKEKINSDGKKEFDLGRPEDLKPQKLTKCDTVQIPFGHYDFVKYVFLGVYSGEYCWDDMEQKADGSISIRKRSYGLGNVWYSYLIPEIIYSGVAISERNL